MTQMQLVNCDFRNNFCKCYFVPGEKELSKRTWNVIFRRNFVRCDDTNNTLQKKKFRRINNLNIAMKKIFLQLRNRPFCWLHVIIWLLVVNAKRQTKINEDKYFSISCILTPNLLLRINRLMQFKRTCLVIGSN